MSITIKKTILKDLNRETLGAEIVAMGAQFVEHDITWRGFVRADRYRYSPAAAPIKIGSSNQVPEFANPGEIWFRFSVDPGMLLDDVLAAHDASAKGPAELADEGYQANVAAIKAARQRGGNLRQDELIALADAFLYKVGG